MIRPYVQFIKLTISKDEEDIDKKKAGYSL